MPQDEVRARATPAGHRLIEAAALRRRAEEALPGYVGDTRRVKTSIALAEKLVKECAPR